MSRGTVLFLYVVAMMVLIVWAAPAHCADGPVFQVCGTQSPTFCGGLSTATACSKLPRDADALYVLCPGNPQPVLTIKGCVGPGITNKAGTYSLTCTSWKQYTLVPK
jgi:hypothetical protein